VRRYIYFDSDSINSYLAQIEGGLKHTDVTELQKSSTVSESDENHTSIVGDIGAKVLGIGANIKGELSLTQINANTTNEFIKSIEEKIIHDYAFDKVFDYLNSKSLIKKSDLSMGDFIESSEEVTLLDFNFFSALFSDNGAVRFSYENEKEELKKLKKAIPKGATIPTLLQNQLNEIDKKIVDSEYERKNMLRIIDVIKSTLPYKRFIMTKNYLVTLDDSCFRDNPDIFAFKYGGNISVLGYVTNIIHSDDNKTYDNDFAPMYQSNNTIMFHIFKNKSEIYIIHPIAIYY
jgi:hypothetical protein